MNKYKGMYDENGRLPLHVVKEMKQRIKESIESQGITKEEFEKSLEDIKNEKNVFDDEDEPMRIDAFAEIRKYSKGK